MNDDQEHPNLDIAPVPSRGLSRFSVVWVVPLLALVVSLAVAWQTFQDRGTLIEVVFSNASGVEAGKTVLKFREVEVGKVETVGFNEDLSLVVVGIRVEKRIAPYVDADSKFWLVRPELTTSGISRLDTVLSGVFIEGLWDNEIKAPETRFVALKKPPLARTPGSGTWITLSSEDGGSLAEGAPVIYRGIKVGQLSNLRLNEGSAGVEVDAFIKSPFDERLTSTSVFWDTSGFSVSFGAQGLKLNVRSVASLIQGGIEFTTLVSGGEPVDAGHKFRLFADETSARDSVFSNALSASAELSLLLDGSIRNLAVGTPVKYRGLPVGEVTGLLIRSDPTPAAELVYSQEVDFAINGEKMGLPDGATSEDVLTFLGTQVKQGLRARVISAGLLGGSLEIELVYLPEATPEVLNLATKPYPVMPTVAPKIADFSSATGDILSRVQKLPIEDVMQSAIRLLDSTNLLIASDETQKAPQEIVGLIDDLRAYVAKDSTQKAPQELTALLADLRTFLAKEGVQQAPEDITALIGDLRGFIQSDGTQKAPAALTALLDDLRAFVAKDGVQKVPDSLVAVVKDLQAFMALDGTQKAPEELTALLTELRGFVASDDVQALPGALRGGLGEAQSILGDIRNEGLVANVTTAIDNVSSAALSVTDAITGLPALVDAVGTMATKVNELPLNDLVASSKDAVDALGQFLGADGMVALPVSLGSALDAFTVTLNDLRDGGAIVQFNATMEAAQKTAQSVAQASDQLPKLVKKLDDVAANVNGLIAGYGQNSAFGRSAMDVLREVQRAAASLGSLAKTIERNPQSLLTGR